MNGIPMEHGLALATILFVIGFAGLLVRRNILYVLMCLEIMMNAAALAFVVAGARWAQQDGSADGQVMFILILALAASEAAIGLAIVFQLYRRFHTLDVDAVSELRG